jgi:hypothetical protein
LVNNDQFLKIRYLKWANTLKHSYLLRVWSIFNQTPDNMPGFFLGGGGQETSLCDRLNRPVKRCLLVV